MDLKLGIKGEYKITECDSGSPEAQNFIKELKTLSGEIFRKKLQEFHSLFSIREEVFYNIVPNVGLNSIAENIINATPSASESLKVLYSAFGGGTTTPAGSDTTLETETYRQNTSSQTRVGNIAYNTTFLDNASGNGNTYSEFGLFMGDATVTADSGTIFSRVLLDPSFEKTVSKTLTIEASHTFTSA